MPAALPVNCDACGRRLGLKAGHYALEDKFIVCGNCLTSHAAHGALFPGCGLAWHRAHDHVSGSATRAGAHGVLQKAGRES